MNIARPISRIGEKHLQLIDIFNQIRCFLISVTARERTVRDGTLNGIHRQRSLQHTLSVHIGNRKGASDITIYAKTTCVAQIALTLVGDFKGKALAEYILQFFGECKQLIRCTLIYGKLLTVNGCKILFSVFGIARICRQQIYSRKIFCDLSGNRIASRFNFRNICLDFLKCHFIRKAIERTVQGVTDKHALCRHLILVLIDVIQLIR